MPPKRPSAKVAAAAPLNLNFRLPADDAWYPVRLAMEGEAVLHVMYCNFSQDFEELYPANRFAGLGELEEFKRRFGPPSVQLQDEECQRVAEGMGFSVSHSFGESDVRFYDAVVESVGSAWTSCGHLDS